MPVSEPLVDQLEHLVDKARLGGRLQTPDQAPSLGRILFHPLQEYVRHIGHVDIARELIDGETGE